MKGLKIFYRVTTGLLCTMMFMSAMFYFFSRGFVQQAYIALGYPVYLLYFNATAKVLGSIALLVPKFVILKQWAYAGFTYLFILALLGHLTIGDGQWIGAGVALVLLVCSYVSYTKLKQNENASNLSN